MALSENPPLDETTVFAYLADVSTASSAFVSSPVRGFIRIARSNIYNAITGADCNWTMEINGTAVTGSATVITQSGSAAGDMDSCEPTAAHFVEVGDVIEFISDGASSTTTPTMFQATIRHV